MPSNPLNILHVFRAPVGGLFRHVLDLSRGQVARGHRVGFVADSTTGGAIAEKALAELAPSLALGVLRVPVGRQLGIGDATAIARVSKRIRETGAQVIHGHGAKGGAYARLSAAPRSSIRAYTPHGGSLLFRPNALLGRMYLSLEAIMTLRRSLYLFESQYSADVFRAKIGNPRGTVRVVHNGVGEADLALVEPNGDATDLIFIGELRPVKGIDILIQALRKLHDEGHPVTATIVGGGPDEQALKDLTRTLGLDAHIRFLPPRPAREAFRFGRIMVVPSRSESLPYIVLEAIGAGVPLITTAVGGIPEIYGEETNHLLPPENPQRLAQAIAAALQEPSAMRALSLRLREKVRTVFSVEQMVNGVLQAYRDALTSP
jgi:glycosyltransferase involved in cell wall biosynthesis